MAANDDTPITGEGNATRGDAAEDDRARSGFIGGNSRGKGLFGHGQPGAKEVGDNDNALAERD